MSRWPGYNENWAVWLQKLCSLYIIEISEFLLFSFTPSLSHPFYLLCPSPKVTSFFLFHTPWISMVDKLNCHLCNILNTTALGTSNITCKIWTSFRQTFFFLLCFPCQLVALSSANQELRHHSRFFSKSITTTLVPSLFSPVSLLHHFLLIVVKLKHAWHKIFHLNHFSSSGIQRADCIYPILLIHSSGHWHLCYFYLLSILNNAFMKLSVH